MIRKARVEGESKYYHVLVKGINGQLLFLDDDDRQAWIHRMCVCFDDAQKEAEIHAFCIMDNHIHMIIRDMSDCLKVIIKMLNASYLLYFNTKYERSGLLFDDMLESELIENEEYYMTVQRYIHQKPEKNALDFTDCYEWSSYREFVQSEVAIVSTNLLLDMLGGVEGFVEYMKTQSDKLCLDINVAKVSDEEAMNIIYKIADGSKWGTFDKYTKEEQIAIALLCKRANIMKAQITRLTGINRWYVEMAWERANGNVIEY